MTPRILSSLFVLVPLFAADTVEVFGLKWSLPTGADWKVEPADGMPALRLLVPRPSTEPRRPAQHALAMTPDYIKVTVEAEARPSKPSGNGKPGSLIIVYAWRDANHFNYAHFSPDTGKEAPVHNGIFHVYGGDRVRISPEDGPRAFPDGVRWYKLKVVYDGTAGRVEAFVDGKSSPSLRGVDLSLGAGKVGIGSFFNTADFRNVRIDGVPAAR